MFRLVRRLVSLVVLVAVVYLAVTFVQVGLASRRDGARPADAIVVFGAAQYNGEPSPVLKARLDHAAELYDQRIAAVVVVTGGSQPGDESNQSEARASADYLTGQKGVPAKNILWETASRNSWEQLASAANELRQRGMDRVVLVSDPFHAARIQAMADELELEATVSPTRTSRISGGTELKHMARETVAVAVGRIIGFRQLVGVDEVRRTVQSG